MKYFTSDATFTYLTLTEVAYDNYLITQEEYLERLYLLRQFCHPNQKDNISNINLRILEFNDWFDTQEGGFVYPDTNEKVKDSSTVAENRNSKDINEEFQGKDYDPMLHFITSTSGTISKWEFHKTDSDPFPSIPHGHAIINHKIKLDAYRGYIFKNNTHFSRESRQYIVELWNDEKFRSAARETIIYYLSAFPLYKWRVANPLRLPRRR